MTIAERQSACAILYRQARASLAAGDTRLALSYQAVAKKFHQELMVASKNPEAYLD